ncbi:hypothetical protein Nepgr_024332 [Nepenthes gracilis]|uniref:RING-type E3 ubiquitin transferase n=1 Tax=Nepenthes gracilis TaxID=150966 RepID=A0AAD3T505_NEPGR|nr:hypothetical protein Nepgr_024332 [Nepenthes gracilis]
MSPSQSSPTVADAAAAAPVDTTPLLRASRQSTRHSRSLRLSRRASLRGAARIIRRASSSSMMREPSVRVRETAAEQIEERQRDWAYSKPVVILDLLWNTVFVMVSISVLILSRDEINTVPLRLWVVGYAVQCALHMVCVCVEYRRRRELPQGRNVGGSDGWRSGGDSYTSGANRSNSSSSGSEGGYFGEFVASQREDEDNTSMAKHLESANTMFSFIWWIIGFYWISSAGETLAQDAPKLYWLCITFLAFDVFFVIICVAVACVIGIAICCCLPCIIAILYAVADQEGATKEDIECLPKYKFRRIGDFEKQNGEIQESFGGIMTECDSDMPIVHVLSLQDAECCICLSSYEDGAELRELPCGHYFHCACIDKWLYINATCPLCKFNILKNGSQSGTDEV